MKSEYLPGFDQEPVTSNQEPVTCLGMTFENDEARRAHFTEELRKKLQDPEFRKIEGFPIGINEDILNLSDPPYYTACPNLWIADFIRQWEAEKSAIQVTGSELPVTGSQDHNQKPVTSNLIIESHLRPM